MIEMNEFLTILSLYSLTPQGMGNNGEARHMNSNMERRLNSSASPGMLNYSMQGHANDQKMRVNLQMQHLTFKNQQQASAQQQMYFHQQQQQQQQQQHALDSVQGQGQGQGQGAYRGQGQEGSAHHQNQNQNQYFSSASPSRDPDSQLMARNFMAEQMMRASSQGGGSIGGGLAQDYSQSQNRRNGINSLGSDSGLNSVDSYGAFGGRRSSADSSHNLLLNDGLGLRSLNSFNSAIDGGQPRRYEDLSLGGVIGLNGNGELVHERGGSVYDLGSNSQERPTERRFGESFRDHTEGSSRDAIMPPGFGHSLSLNGSANPTRRPSASMQLAAKSFSERDKMERDRGLGNEAWNEPTYSLDRDIIEDRLRDRYTDNDFNNEKNKSELFTSAALGGSSNQMLSDENSTEFFDPRGSGLGRGYQQSLSTDPYQNQTHGKNGSALFLQQRDDDLQYEKEFSLRDRQHQLQALQRQQEEDDQHQRLILQNQLAGVQRLAFRAPQNNIFDPKKWI